MARLETQVHQIYLSPTPPAKSSIIIYDELLENGSHIFFVAELKDISKKTEKDELKKVADIILDTFKENKRATTEALFETVLSKVNDKLAELAAKSKKSLGNKFSAVLTIKNGENIFLTNSGFSLALLKRKSELMEILSAEKKEIHPLKTFSNFSMGKIKAGDELVLSNADLLNFVAIQHLGQILNNDETDEVVAEISSILKDSINSNRGFGALLLKFTYELPKPPPKPEPQINVFAPIPEITVEQAIAASEVKPKRSWFKIKLPSIPKPNFAWIKWEWFTKLSPARKFFFISFVIFIILFIMNVGVFLFRKQQDNTQNKIEQQVEIVNKNITDAEAAFIFQNENEAAEMLKAAYDNLAILESMDPSKAAELKPKLDEIGNQINRLSIVSNPKIFAVLKRNPTFLAKAGNSFVTANSNANSVAVLNNGTHRELFLLNTTDGDITGLNFVSSLGIVLTTKDKIYRVNETDKQFDLLQTIANGNLKQLRTLSSGRLYTLNQTNDQVQRFILSEGGLSQPQSLIRTGGIELESVKDVGLDTDVYLLYPDKIRRFNNGSEISFNLATMQDPLTEAEKIFVGDLIYILEPAKKRLIVFTKTGRLENQYYFPTSERLSDFYVDETQRNIYLLDNNKLLQITF